MEKRAALAALKGKRERTVVLVPDEPGKPGKKVTFLRPREVEFNSMLKKVDPADKTATWEVSIEHVRKYVNGWSGFTEDDILGAGVGTSEPLEFDQELWDEFCSDDIDWVGTVAKAILESVVDYLAAQAAVAKNSVPA